MALFRSKGDRFIDSAHNDIGNAEMQLAHSFNDADIASANAELALAQDFLRRAIETKQAWDAVDHDDYEEYPNVPRRLVPLAAEPGFHDFNNRWSREHY